MIYTRTGTILKSVDTCELMTHFVNHRACDFFDRAIKVLSAHIQFMYAFAVFVLVPNLVDRPPAVSLVARIDLHRDNRFHKFATEQMLVDEVVQFSEIRDRFDIPFRSVFQFSLSFVKKMYRSRYSTFDTRVKLYMPLPMRRFLLVLLDTHYCFIYNGLAFIYLYIVDSKKIKVLRDGGISS